MGLRVARDMRVRVTLVSLTSVNDVTYTAVHCACGLRIMDIPGVVNAEARMCGNYPSGDGRVVKCSRCRRLCEVVEHGCD